MYCPPDILDALLEILYLGILRIRSDGQTGNAERCAIEADHLHNLPNTIKNYSDDRLVSYYQLQVQGYIARSAGQNVNCFRPAWSKIASYLQMRKLI